MSAKTAESSDDLVEAWVALELREGRAVQLRVLGRSMWPWLKSGDRVTLSPVNVQELSLGQVVISWRSSAASGARLSALHRVLWIADGLVFTKGDGLPRCDEPAARGEVLGYVSALECSTRGGGWAQRRCRLRAWVAFGPLWPVAVLTSVAVALTLWCKRLLTSNRG